jgi:hypothetical protein
MSLTSSILDSSIIFPYLNHRSDSNINWKKLFGDLARLRKSTTAGEQNGYPD